MLVLKGLLHTLQMLLAGHHSLPAIEGMLQL
jgi:hypothetical protein